MKKITALFTCLLLCACSTTQHNQNYQAALAKKDLNNISPQDFPHCRNYGCDIIERIVLPDSDWPEIEELFEAGLNAEQERDAIATAIGLFEIKVGAINDTIHDKAGTFTGLGHKNQHDCVDESMNTTIYLLLLAQKGLIRHHRVAAPTARSFVTTLGSMKLWPHQTAIITDKDSSKSFAVDSWFHDGGHKAEIVPLDQWYKGWSPARERHASAFTISQ